MKLTDHFDSDEFGPNLTAQDMQNYYLLALFILDTVRDRFGVVQITSGKRSEEHNKEVGGSPTSQHLFGEAADFICPHAPNGMGEVYIFLLSEAKWPGEVIWYKKRGHIHVALPRLGVHADHFIEEEV